MSNPVGFWSYARSDDAHSDGQLSQLRTILGKAISLQYGADVRVWQDIQATPPGADWAATIERTISQTTFFIPIVTPRFLKSTHCAEEFRSFRNRMIALGRDDLIFPILYVSVDQVNIAETAFGQELAALRRHQWSDFRPLRHADPRSPEVCMWVDRLADSILGAAVPASIAEQSVDPIRRREEIERTVEEARRREEAQDLAEAARRRQEGEKAAEEARLRQAKRMTDDTHREATPQRTSVTASAPSNKFWLNTALVAVIAVGVVVYGLHRKDAGSHGTPTPPPPLPASEVVGGPKQRDADSSGSSGSASGAAPSSASDGVASDTRPTPPPPSAMMCNTVLACGEAMLNFARDENTAGVMDAVKIINSFPKPQHGERKQARDLNEIGLKAMNDQKFDDAIDAFSQANQADPRDEEIISNLVVAYAVAGNLPKAKDAAVLALAINPSRTTVWAALAETFAKNNQKDAAVEAMWLAYQFSGDKQKTLDFIDTKLSTETDPSVLNMYTASKAWLTEQKQPSFAD